MDEKVHLAFTHDIVLALTNFGDLRQILQDCAQAMVNHLDASFARIWTVADSGDMLELKASAGMYTHIDGPHARVPVGRFKIGMIAAERRPHLTNDVLHDPRVGDREWAARENLVAFAGHPLLLDSKLVGVMALFSRKPLSDFILQTLANTANTIAMGVERLRSEEALKSYAGQMQQKNEELLAARDHFRFLIDAMPNGIIAVDKEGRINLMNTEAEKLFGYGREEVLGQEVEVLIPARYHSAHRGTRAGFWLQPQARAMGAGGNLFGLRKGGSEFPVEIGLKPVHAAGDVAILASIVDITERKRYEEKILEATRLKSQFLANMSHEIRTPMNVLIGMTGLLLDTELSAEQRDLTETTNRAATSLLSVINDILDFSKIEAGKMDISTVDFSVDRLIEDTVEQLAEQAARKGLELTCFISPDVPATLHGDSARLGQVITNLLGNAVKFTSQGEVNVVVRPQKSADDAKIVLRVEVRDTGIGIPPKVQANLFHAFTQADGSTSRKYGGSGLGLAICKKLVELMGGEIGLESDAGKGTTFWVALPLELPRETAPPLLEAAVNLQGLKVLAVDDLETNRLIIQKQLASFGMQCTVASNALEAIMMMREAVRVGEPVDLVILDHGMPGMTGIDVARIVHADPSIAATPMIMLTSYGSTAQGFRQQANEVGIGICLTKPLRKSQLRQSVARAVGRSVPVLPPVVAQAGERVPLPVGGCGRLLLVEDNSDNQKLALRLIGKWGYECDVASNGLEALTALAAFDYPLVLMDCQMPEMDGLQATAAIRLREGTSRHTTIIAMTANAIEGDRQVCLDAGMDDYVSKPIDPARLILVIERWLRAGSPSNRKEENAKETIRFNAIPGLEDLIPEYLSNRKRDILTMRAALAKDDLEIVRLVGHSMKGSGSGYGFPAITGFGREIERAAGIKDRPEIVQQIAKLADYLSRLEAAAEPDLESTSSESLPVLRK